MHQPRHAFVGAGANLGDRAATIRAAAEELRKCPGVASVRSSSWYETAPVGLLDQPSFINAVYALETTLSPESLLRELQRIENAHGRVRHERWGPRTLDLDLLYYAGETRRTEELTLPHPRMFDRAFVLVPLRELLRTERIARGAPAEFIELVDRAKVDTDGVSLFLGPP